jgi:fibronectin-binding autotransporter adhesin
MGPASLLGFVGKHLPRGIGAGLVALLLGAQPVSAQVVWSNLGNGDWAQGSNWVGGSAPGSGAQASIANGGTATIGLSATTVPSSGSFNEVWDGDGNTGTGGTSTPGNINQLTGTTLNNNYWFEIGRLYGYNGAVVSAANNVSTYTLNGTAAVVNGSGGNQGNAEIGWGWTNGNGLSNTTGILTLNDSSTFTQNGWMVLGQADAGGVGILNINNNAVATVATNGGQYVTLGNHNGASGTINVSGNGRFIEGGNNNLYLAGNGAVSASGALNMSGNAAVSAWDIRVGTNGNGVMSQTGGTATVNGWLRVGESQGAVGVYNFSSGVTNANLMARIGEDGSGTLNMSGNALMNVAQDFTMGLPVDNNTQPGSGVFSIANNAVLNVSGGFYAGSAGGTGMVTVGSNAYIHLIGGGRFAIADSDNDTGFNNGGPGNLATSGTVTQTGGTITLDGGEFWVGQHNGSGVYNMSGGVLNVNNWFAVGRGGATGVVNMSGGTINKSGGGNIIVGSLSGNGTWNMNGGLVNNTTNLILGENSNTGTFNLNGGTVQATGVGDYSATGYLYFNGGVLQATANNTAFLSTNGTTSNVIAYIQAGGANINTNGFSIATSNAIAPDPGLPFGTPDGGLHKKGAGTLGLSGANTFAGASTVNAGVLLITGNPTTAGSIEVTSGGTLGTDTLIPAVTVDAGGTFAAGYTFTSSLALGNAQPASLTTSPGGILAFKLSNSASSGNDMMTVTGSMSLANGTIINVSKLLNGSLSLGTYDLISAPSNTTPVGTLTLTGIPVSRTSYSLSSSQTYVDLVVAAGGPNNLVWRGGVNGNAWDVLVSKNWYNTTQSAVDYFYNLDNVTFNDSGAANGNVNVAVNVQPGSVAFSLTSAASAYSLSGTGGITGTTGLVMSGSGSLTIANPNTYSGETDIHGGNVTINASGALGDASNTNATYIAGPAPGDAAALTLNSGGTLSGTSIAIAQATGSSGTLAQNGGFVNAANGLLTIGGSGAGTYAMSDGTISATALTLGQGSGASGAITQNGGIVNLGGASQLSVGITGSGSYTIGGSGALNLAGNGGFFRVGGFDATGAGSFTQNGNSVVNLGTSASGVNFASIAAGGSGSYTLNSGTLNVFTSGNQFNVGDRAGGPGVMFVNGGVANITGGFNVGKNTGAQGTVTQIAGQVTLPGPGNNLEIGSAGGATGTYNLSGGAVTAWDIRNDSGTAYFNQSGGTATTDGGWLRLGINTGASMVYTLSGATSVFNASNRINIGESGGGTFDQYDGLVNVPNENTYIATNGGGTGTYALSGGTINTGDIRVGVGGSGTFVQTGGVANLRYWLRVGEAQGSTGNYSFSGGTINVSQMARVGECGSGTLSMSGNALMNVAQDFTMGLPIDNNTQPGSGVFSIANNAVLTVAGTGFFAGSGGGTAAVTVGDNAYIHVIGNGRFAIGDTDNDTGFNNGGPGNLTTAGTVTQTGGTITLDNGEFWVGQDTNGSGVYNMSGGALNVNNNWFIIGRASSMGSATLSGSGVITKSGAGNSIIGDNGTSTLLQTGGTLDLNTGELWVGQNGSGNGLYTMQGGVLDVNSWLAVGRSGATGVVNMTGGTINKAGLNNIIVGSLGGNGTWNMDGGLVNNNSNLILGEGSNTGTFYLNGGTVQATAIGNYGGTSVGYLYFNGGVLQASASNSAFLANAAVNAYVQAGGAIIDTNGYNIGISNAIAPDPALVGTDGGLLKAGAGMLTLTATNTYQGPTIVTAGTLSISGSGVLGSSGTYSANIGIGSGALFDYDSAATQALSGNISGSGALAVTGSGTLILSGVNTYGGGTNVLNGTLVVDATTALADGSSLIVGQGASSLFAPAVGPSLEVSSSNVAVPEPGTLSLVAAGGLTLLIALRRRASKLR